MARVEIKLKTHGTFIYLDGVSKRARKLPPKDLWNLTQTGARMLKESAMEAGIKSWKKHLFSRNGIRPVKLGTGKFGIQIPLYGIHLDRMKRHWVSLRRGGTIAAWAEEKKVKGRAIQVRRHPYINRGFRRMVARANIVANRLANKIVGG